MRGAKNNPGPPCGGPGRPDLLTGPVHPFGSLAALNRPPSDGNLPNGPLGTSRRSAPVNPVSAVSDSNQSVSSSIGFTSTGTTSIGCTMMGTEAGTSGSGAVGTVADIVSRVRFGPMAASKQ